MKVPAPELPKFWDFRVVYKIPARSEHRYISSAKRYLQSDLENLHEIVNNFHHPIG